MLCRIAGYIGCAPQEVRDLPCDEWDLLVLYFETEPWGAWRDNFHAAMIAREVRRVWSKRNPPLKTWWFENPVRRAAQNVAGFKMALVAMADPVFGEKACACIVPQPGESLTLDELVAFLRQQRIASFKLPERLELMTEFPISPVGKILKRQLREIVEGRIAAAG
jgi:acyl-CoA synthetase (AMP-forming)/AMP-acid ligase II